jgi:hypothetical protein
MVPEKKAQRQCGNAAVDITHRTGWKLPYANPNTQKRSKKNISENRKAAAKIVKQQSRHGRRKASRTSISPVVSNPVVRLAAAATAAGDLGGLDTQTPISIQASSETEGGIKS